MVSALMSGSQSHGELMTVHPPPIQPCSALTLVNLLLRRIPFLLSPAWHFYYGLYIWSLGHATLSWHWPSCSPVCVSKGCLKFRWIRFQSMRFREHVPLKGPVEAPCSRLDSSVGSPFSRGRGVYWVLTAGLAPENTASQNSLSPLFALSECSYRLITETFSAPTLTFTHDFISTVFLALPLFIHTSQYSGILYQAQISIMFECLFYKSN